jgi:hypothetical protein
MRKALIIIFAFILIGCATNQNMQPLPVFEVKKGSKIGVLNFVSPKMKQYHIGTTVFNNFEKEHEVNWDLPGLINSEISKQASELGYETVIIGSDDTLKTKLSDRTIKEGDKLVLNPNTVPTLKSIAKDYNISMLYIIEPLKSSIFLPNITVAVEGYGVGTRNILMIGGVEAFAMLNASSICMDPLSATKGAICSKSQDVTGLKMVGNFRNLTEDEKSEYGKVIKGFIKGFVSNLLTNSNLI